MKFPNKLVVLALLSSFVLGGLCGCEKEPETPGEKLDDMLDKAGETLEDAGEQLEDAGRKLKTD